MATDTYAADFAASRAAIQAAFAALAAGDENKAWALAKIDPLLMPTVDKTVWLIWARAAIANRTGR